jgi:Flp pilus assembly protein TadG
MRPTERRRRQRGTQIVELAIALPLIALIVFMIVEGADFIRVHQVINNAAREGARFSVLPENSGHTGAIQSVVVTYANNNGVALTTANVTVNQGAVIPTASGIGMLASQITVTYPYTLKYLPSLSGFAGSGTVTLQGAAEFRNFY